MDKQKLIECIKQLSTFGSKEYIELYKILNLVNQLDEPQKVVIPKSVADWVEYCKDKGYTLKYALYFTKESENEEVYKWVNESLNNQETFAIAWINGYEIEKEKKYSIRIKNITSDTSFLKYDGVVGKWYFGMYSDTIAIRLYHTKEDLIEGGFEWVFSCEGVEVDEVTE